MEYKELIENKRVVFVGGCPNIVGRNMQEQIESFDTVIKTNGSVFLKGEKYYKDFGKRIDVLYSNAQFAREMNPLPVRHFVEKGIKYLCMKGCEKRTLEEYRRTLPVRTLEKVISEVQKTVYGALMGNFILYDLLQHNPKELFVTGIDFFVSKKPEFEHDNYKEYVDGYLPDKIRKQGNQINKGKKEDGHDFYGNSCYMYKLFKENDNLKTNDFIYELLVSIVNKEVKQGDISWNR